MSEQLSYALITPYSLYKSRTGGIIGRLLAQTKLEFVGARMYVFSDAFVDAYLDVFCHDDMEPAIAEAWRNYLNRSLRPNNPWGFLPRCMMLLFKGPDAVRHLKEDVIGSFTEQPVGDTIRGTYGDFIREPQTGTIHYFEPAVITCSRPDQVDQHLKLLADYARTDGGVLAGRVEYDQPDAQCSLVMLKPDNFYRRSRRPGNIIDAFSLTGLRIVGAKLFSMTVAQGERFYGPLKHIFVDKLKGNVTKEIYSRLGDAFEYPFEMDDAEHLADRLAERNAVYEFNRIVEYMTGVNPDDVSEAEKATASKTKCLGLLYEGPNAIEKIREVLGSTDPQKAEPGTVRSDFGRDLMRNGAHASDSPENALREREIVGLVQTENDASDIERLIGEHTE